MGSVGTFCQKLYLGVKKMCKKFRELPTVGLDLYRGTLLTTPPNRAMDSSLCQKKNFWISAFLLGGIIYFVNIGHYANFQIYRPINDTEHPT